MSSKERILAAWRGEPHDHVPFTTWSFGFKPPEYLRWTRDGKDVTHWFSKRLEHIHTLPLPWELEDDFQRVLAWQSLGIDDILDVSVPWSIDPGVTWQDSAVEAGELDEQYPVNIREYKTPSGKLRHAIKKTGEEIGPGWVLQPKDVPLFEDFNIPRAVKPQISRQSSTFICLRMQIKWIGLKPGWEKSRPLQTNTVYPSKPGLRLEWMLLSG